MVLAAGNAQWKSNARGGTWDNPFIFWPYLIKTDNWPDTWYFLIKIHFSNCLLLLGTPYKLYFYNVILIQVVEPFSEWEPPEFPNELLNTASYKIFNELWTLAAKNEQIWPKKEREKRLMATDEEMAYKTCSLPENVKQMVRTEKGKCIWSDHKGPFILHRNCLAVPIYRLHPCCKSPQHHRISS